MPDPRAVLYKVHQWLVDEYSELGAFIHDIPSATVYARSYSGLGSIFAVEGNHDDYIVVNLGLNTGISVSCHSDSGLDDAKALIREIIDSGISLSVPLEPFGDPIIRYTVRYGTRIDSSRVKGYEYVDFWIPGWRKLSPTTMD